MAYDLIAGALRSRNIAVDDQVLVAALDDEEQGPALARWAEVHLTPDTLLTADEYDLCVRNALFTFPCR